MVGGTPLANRPTSSSADMSLFHSSRDTSPASNARSTPATDLCDASASRAIDAQTMPLPGVLPLADKERNPPGIARGGADTRLRPTGVDTKREPSNANAFIGSFSAHR